MATETEKLYNENAGTATSPDAAATTATATTPAETTPAAPAETPAAPANTPYTTGNATLDSYNTGRVDQINKLYDTQRDAALGQLEAANKRTMSDWQAAYDKITPGYQQSRNAVGATYERQRRNNNIQAAANGLNTGAGSQMQLAASSVYQQNQAGLEKAEKDALAEANRQQITLKEQYDADVADALAKNDAQRAAALLDEFGQQYERMQNEAKQLAAYGDFSMYAQLYGTDAAMGMQRAWDLQNPQLAYALGRITADEYFQMTGKYPPGYGGGGGGGSSSSRSSGYYGGGGGGGGDNNKVDTTYTTVKNALQAGYTLNDIKSVANNPSLVEQQYQLATGMKHPTIAPASGGARGVAGVTKSSSSSSSSSSSGGSTTHTSSSGSTHGGSGGSTSSNTSIISKAANAIKNLLK